MPPAYKLKTPSQKMVTLDRHDGNVGLSHILTHDMKDIIS